MFSSSQYNHLFLADLYVTSHPTAFVFPPTEQEETQARHRSWWLLSAQAAHTGGKGNLTLIWITLALAWFGAFAAVKFQWSRQFDPAATDIYTVYAKPWRDQRKTYFYKAGVVGPEPLLSHSSPCVRSQAGGHCTALLTVWNKAKTDPKWKHHQLYRRTEVWKTRTDWGICPDWSAAAVSLIRKISNYPSLIQTIFMVRQDFLWGAVIVSEWFSILLPAILL